MTNFVLAVRESFDGLAKANAMSCEQEEEHNVRYESDSVVLGVGWVRWRSYEVGVAFRLKTEGGHPPPIELPDILRFQGLTAIANEIEVVRIGAEEDCRPVMMRLAELTQEYGGRFLAGDPASYASFASFMEDRIAEYNAKFTRRGQPGPQGK